MASRSPDPEAHPDPPADDIVRSAAARALGSNRRLRLVAIALWCSFLGTALLLGAALAVLPADFTHAMAWAEASAAFLGTWVLVLVPVSLALALAPAPAARGRHG